MKGDFNDENDERKSLIFVNHWPGIEEPASEQLCYK